jgi:hypothetical protein
MPKHEASFRTRYSIEASYESDPGGQPAEAERSFRAASAFLRVTKKSYT